MSQMLAHKTYPDKFKDEAVALGRARGSQKTVPC